MEAAVSTPQSNAVVPGGFWRRFAAVIIDGVVMNILFIVLIPVHLMLAPVVGQETAQLIRYLPQFALSFAYVYYFYTKKGATPGKMAFNMKVLCAETGKNLNGKQIFMREYVGRFLSTITLLIGYFMVLFRKDRKAMHDLVAGTRVLRMVK